MVANSTSEKLIVRMEKLAKRKWNEVHGWKSMLAQELGVDPSMIARWLARSWSPSLRKHLLIEAWCDKEEIAK